MSLAPVHATCHRACDHDAHRRADVAAAEGVCGSGTRDGLRPGDGGGARLRAEPSGPRAVRCARRVDRRAPASAPSTLANEPDGGQRPGEVEPTRCPCRSADRPDSRTESHTPALDINFEGIGNPVACGGCTPPDTNGEYQPGYYVQTVNATKVGIFNKTGTLLAPAFNMSTLWPAGNACAANRGDPVVLYDPLADRWLLSQLNNPTHTCIAISQTADPLGSYHLYTFNVGSFPDYLKFGVWPNAYYMSANEATYTAYAFDRTKMLVGDPTATFVKFSGQTNFLFPADVDGPTAPLAGSPVSSTRSRTTCSTEGLIGSSSSRSTQTSPILASAPSR